MQSDGTYRYSFDAENRIACMNPDVNWVCNTNSVNYTYDADSRRVQKSSGTNYWYGPGGNVLAETDNAGVWTNYIFFGGQRLARNVNGDIKYYITDHLHSTAMFVDKAGTTAAILDDNDMYPWGGIVPGVGKTTSNNTVKFTGQYRDTESQLDYFGARYYSNSIGRFMSPDWAAKPTTVPYAKFGDPQSLNLYSYVENGPVNRIDADGHGFINEAFQDWGMDGNWADPGSGTTAKPADGNDNKKDKKLPKPDAQHNHTITVRKVEGQGGNLAGHVTVQIDGGKEVGYGPKKDMTKKEVFANKSVPGQVEPRATGVKTVDQVTINITDDQAKAALQVISERIANPGDYRPMNNNCTQFAMAVVNAAGGNAPISIEPGDLIMELREQQYDANSTQPQPPPKQ